MIEKEKIEKTMESIFSSLIEGAKREATENELYKFINENKQWLHDPDECETMIISKFKQIITQCVENFYGTDDYKIQIIYTEWAYFENNIRKIVENIEGFGCCADKTRHVIRCYINYLTSKQMPEWKKEWYQPQNGTADEWFNFVDGLIDLYYGKPQKYLLALKKLMYKNDDLSETWMSSQ